MSAKQLPENKRPLARSHEAEQEGTQQGPDSHPQDAAAQLQRTAGNAAVQRMLAQREGEGTPQVSPLTAEKIQGKLGDGQAIDSAIAAKAGGIVGDDFSDVRVHTDAESDQLNRQLEAKAFATGNDIFFRQDAYDPHTTAGQKLITHELTHVSQQSGESDRVQTKLTVNEPNDPFEKEADRMAEQVTGDTATVQRQPELEEEVALKADPSLQRDALPDEELDVQRQELSEDEMGIA